MVSDVGTWNPTDTSLFMMNGLQVCCRGQAVMAVSGSKTVWHVCWNCSASWVYRQRMGIFYMMFLTTCATNGLDSFTKEALINWSYPNWMRCMKKLLFLFRNILKPILSYIFQNKELVMSYKVCCQLCVLQWLLNIQDAFHGTCMVKPYVAILQNFQAFVYTNSNMAIMQTLDDYLQDINFCLGN